MPCSSMRLPRTSRIGANGWNFFWLIQNFAPLRRLYNHNNTLLWFSTELVLVKMSLNQTCRRLPISPCSSQVNAHWKVQGALQSPCCIVLELYVPWGIENVILWTSSGSTCICSYMSDILILDQYFVLATDSWISRMSGIGVMSRIVFELRFLMSITVHKDPSALQIQSSRHACSLLAGYHHPAFT